MNISVSHLMESLPVMGMGMLGIFIVMLIIYAVTFAMSRMKMKRSRAGGSPAGDSFDEPGNG